MMKCSWGKGALALVWMSSIVVGCAAEESVDDDDRIANGFDSEIPGVGALLAYVPGSGWEPVCTATVYRGNTLVSVEHCFVPGYQLAFTTDFDMPRGAGDVFDMPNADVRQNGLLDARQIVETRIIEHPDLSNEAFAGSEYTEGVALFRVDEAYGIDWWWNILDAAYGGQTAVVGYGMDPHDTDYEQGPNDPERDLSRGRQRLGFMDVVGFVYAPPGDPPPLLEIVRTVLDQGACHADSGSPGFQYNSISSISSRITAECYEDGSNLLSVFAPDYRERIDEVVDEWNPCLLRADFNGDDAIGAADYTIWRDHKGCVDCRPTEGDANGDSFVDDADYDAWKNAYGMTCPSAAGASACGLQADFDGDGTVGMTDFYALWANYNQCDGGCVHADGDADGDGLVTYSDFGVLAGEWGQSC